MKIFLISVLRGICILICFQACNGYAQDLKFRHLTIDHGLSQNAVYSILQDSRGFMWFGTKDGLNRYDGRNFAVYQHNPFASTSISDAYVTKLLEDSRGDIWTGSLSGDVNILNRETDLFCEIPLENESGEKITTNEITDIAEAPDGAVWIATKGDGLIKILADDQNGCNYNFKLFLHDPADDQSLSSNRVGNLFFLMNIKHFGLELKKASFNFMKAVNHFPEPYSRPGIRMHQRVQENTKSQPCI